MLSAAVGAVAAFFGFIISALQNERCDSLSIGSARYIAEDGARRTKQTAKWGKISKLKLYANGNMRARALRWLLCGARALQLTRSQ